MHRFEFFSTARIVFGRGRTREIGGMAMGLGSRALVLFNGATPGDGGPVDRVEASLHEAGVATSRSRQKGEPSVGDVEAGLAAARETGSNLIVGVGGGSAIDCAKAVAGILANGGSPLDYMEVVGAGRPLARPATPWIAVPTTAGTGAEVTRNAVVGDLGRKFKASIRSELLLPRVALVDPELGVGAPPGVTAASGMDALCQLIESYTSTGANPMTDALAVVGIAAVAQSLRGAYLDGVSLDAREGMALAALLSGITLMNAGLGAVHGFAAPLGANFPAPHGVVCAALLPHVMMANVAALEAESPEHPVLARYADVGRMLAAAPARGAGAPADGIAAVSSLTSSLNIPRLSAFGIGEQDVPEMVRLARRSSSMKYNPVTLSDEVLADVLRRAL